MEPRWIDGEFGYALTGKLPRITLLELSKVVYSQLTGEHLTADKTSPAR